MNSNKKIAFTSRIVRSIRVSKLNDTMLKNIEYPGVLIGVLLDAYFANELPNMKIRYTQRVKTVIEEKRENGKRTGTTSNTGNKSSI
jgi:hypothetical protein